jgi:diacylglycerol kinase
MIHEHEHAPSRGWAEKFADAFRGLKVGIRGQVSFFVHFFMAAAVVGAAAVLRASLVEWCILLLCIAVVLVAEMFNTAMESLARAITDQMNPNVGFALDIGSAAVLLAAFGATIVGAIIFIHRLGVLLAWWCGNGP